MQVAYMAQRAHPDIQTAIAFQQTWVTKPDEDEKLGPVEKVLCSTKAKVPTVSMAEDGILTWCVDASSAVHNDMHGIQVV